MAENIANVVLSTDTFAIWLSRTNQVIEAMRTKVVSTSNTVVGNVSVTGTITTSDLVANNISATSVYVSNNTVWHGGNDGAGSGLDADLLDGQQGTYYSNVTARLGYTPLNSTTYTAADVLAKILTVDGAGSGLDADTLDGQSSSYYQDAANLTAGILPAARLSGAYSFANLTISANASVVNFTASGNFVGNTASFSNVVSTNLSGNGAGVTSVNAATLNSKADTYFANSTHSHAFSDITGTTQVVKYDTAGRFAKPQRSTIGAATDGATVTLDFDAYQMYSLTLGGNRIIANPNNIASAIGQEIVLYLVQDATGTRVPTWGSYWKFPSGTAPVLTTTANAVDCVVGIVYSATQIFCSGLIRDIK